MLRLVMQRLIAEVPTLRQVAGAADLATAEDDMKRAPAAFVLPIREAPGQNYLELGVSQRVVRTFGVLLASRNLRDARGEEAYVELESLRDQVMAAYLNWQPDTDHEPCEYAGGRLIRLSNAVLWWQDEFRTAHLVRAV